MLKIPAIYCPYRSILSVVSAAPSHPVRHPKQNPSRPLAKVAQPSAAGRGLDPSFEHLGRPGGQLAERSDLAQSVLREDRTEAIEAHGRYLSEEIG